MPRTRVHNLNISLDGFAAGEHVTLDAPIGGAEGCSPDSTVDSSTGSTALTTPLSLSIEP